MFGIRQKNIYSQECEIPRKLELWRNWIFHFPTSIGRYPQLTQQSKIFRQKCHSFTLLYFTNSKSFFHSSFSLFHLFWRSPILHSCSAHTFGMHVRSLSIAIPFFAVLSFPFCCVVLLFFLLFFFLCLFDYWLLFLSFFFTNGFMYIFHNFFPFFVCFFCLVLFFFLILIFVHFISYS